MMFLHFFSVSHRNSAFLYPFFFSPDRYHFNYFKTTKKTATFIRRASKKIYFPLGEKLILYLIYYILLKH